MDKGMEEKRIQLVITKYYLLSWLFGITSWIFVYFQQYTIATIGLFLCIIYSIADAKMAPPRDWQPPENFDNNGQPPTAI